MTTITCPHCKTPNRNTARFCSGCGASLIAAYEQTVTGSAANPPVAEPPAPAAGSPVANPAANGPAPISVSVLHKRYFIETELGRGGFGAVYRARDTSLNRPCAVKENLDNSPEAQRQFAREAMILANLSHPNLPRVTDHFSLPGQGQYLVMDFVEGEDLASMQQRQPGPVPVGQALGWIRQVADALTYMHSLQPPVLHRDIKPANIRITPEGRAMLVDFGLVKVFDPHMRTTMGARAVTPGFAPPEQYGQGNTDARTDVYALGATLYTLVTGNEPLESVQRMIGKQMPVAQQVNPQVPAAVSRAIERAMKLEPSQRYQTMAEFRAALPMPEKAVVALAGKTAGALPGTQALRAPATSPTGIPAVRSLVNKAGKTKLPMWAMAAVAGVLVIMVSFVLIVTALLGSRNVNVASSSVNPMVANEKQQGVLFTSNRDGKQEVYRLTGGGLERVTQTSGNAESWSPIAEPDGSILFVSNRSGKQEIYRLTKNGVEQVTRTPGNAESWWPIPEPGGNVLFVSNRDGKRDIYRLTKTGVERVINTPGRAESWSPAPERDGSILFVSNRDGKPDIYRLTKSGVERVTVSPGVSGSWLPVPDANGNVLFVSNRDGKKELYRLTNNGVEQVTQTPGKAESWSPLPELDGGILFESNRDGKREIYRLTRNGLDRVTQTPGDKESWLMFDW